MKSQVRPSRLQNNWTPVPNNPRDNQLYIDKKEMNKEKKFNKDMMLFDKTEDVLKKVVSKREPGEPLRTQYLKVDKDKFNKDMEFWKKRNQQASARERLKRKGAVPTKSGNKLFEEFVRDCRDRGHLQEAKDNAVEEKLRNIYNSAQHLEYDDWVWFINDQYKGRI